MSADSRPATPATRVAKLAERGAGGDRTHGRRTISPAHRLPSSPTCADVLVIASAVPRSVRFARIPLARSLPGQSPASAPATCRSRGDVASLRRERSVAVHREQLKILHVSEDPAVRGRPVGVVAHVATTTMFARPPSTSITVPCTNADSSLAAGRRRRARWPRACRCRRPCRASSARPHGRAYGRRAGGSLLVRWR